MCILPGETFIETHLKSDGVFEADTVNGIVKAMTVYENATFLGKNCNLVHEFCDNYFRLWFQHWHDVYRCG